MVVSENTLKWIMRFYPPLFFQRIWVVKFDAGFMGVKVNVKKSFFNRNYHKTIFGGTIFSAADPFYPVLFHQALSARGHKVVVWLKSCSIQYLKPARTNLQFDIKLTEQDIAEAQAVMQAVGKHVQSYPVAMFNNLGELCATLQCEVYMRDLNFIDKNREVTT